MYPSFLMQVCNWFTNRKRKFKGSKYSKITGMKAAPAAAE